MLISKPHIGILKGRRLVLSVGKEGPSARGPRGGGRTGGIWLPGAAFSSACSARSQLAGGHLGRVDGLSPSGSCWMDLGSDSEERIPSHSGTLDWSHQNFLPTTRSRNWLMGGMETQREGIYNDRPGAGGLPAASEVCFLVACR